MTDQPTPAEPTEGGLEFPCQYPVKAMGKAGTAFEKTVIGIVAAHAEVGADQVRSRDSKGGNYQSVTVTINASSREHLERIYIALREHRDVLWTL